VHIPAFEITAGSILDSPKLAIEIAIESRSLMANRSQNLSLKQKHKLIAAAGGPPASKAGDVPTKIFALRFY
jgi:hypothetical protein